MFTVTLFYWEKDKEPKYLSVKKWINALHICNGILHNS